MEQETIPSIVIVLVQPNPSDRLNGVGGVAEGGEGGVAEGGGVITVFFLSGSSGGSSGPL